MHLPPPVLPLFPYTTLFRSEPVYLATVAGGDTQIIPVDGEPRAEFDRQRIIDIVAKEAQSNGGAEITVLDQYDRYYLDRRRERSEEHTSELQSHSDLVCRLL